MDVQSRIGILNTVWRTAGSYRFCTHGLQLLVSAVLVEGRVQRRRLRHRAYPLSVPPLLNSSDPSSVQKEEDSNYDVSSTHQRHNDCQRGHGSIFSRSVLGA